MPLTRVCRDVAGYLLLAIGGCGNGPSEPTIVPPPSSLIGRFDLFWETFDQQYSYFSYKGINWDSLRTVYRPRAEAATSQDELVGVLKEMVAPLRDIHVKFVTPSGQTQLSYQPPAPMNWNRDLWLQTIGQCAYRQRKPNLGACTMRGMAYVVVGSWNSSTFSTTDLDAMIDEFRDAPGVVIDVRPNGGGNDALAFNFAGRFATRSTPVGYVRYRDGRKHDDFGAEITRTIGPRGSFQYGKPVVVLSGRGIFSSNESFIAAMRELPNVTILGDTTGGGTGNPKTFPLGDGWSYSVSRWIEWTVDRRVIEWNGIPPDVFVPWDPATLAQGRDPVLEAALVRLGAPPR